MADLLAGTRVIEVANWLAAPSAAAMLADLGADVIKVEPPNGDAWRGNVAGAGERQHSWAFEGDNRGKRGITVNLDRPEGQAVIQRLAAGADIFITNLVPGRTERFDLTYERLSRDNPRLIYAHLTAVGQEGAERDRLGFDFSAYWARTGMMQLVGDAEAPPMLQRAGMGDHATALALLSGILAALLERERTGQGQALHCSLLNTGLWVLGSDLQIALGSGSAPPKRRATAPPNPIQNRYRCADGRWLLLYMPAGGPYWARLCAALGRPDLADDPRFASLELRAANSVDLCALLAELIATRTLAEWTKALDGHDLIWEPVALPEEAIHDPQARANGYVAPVDHPTFGPIEVLSTPIRFGETPLWPRGPAPEVGQHTEEVLLEAGYSWEAISDLRAAGAL